MTGRRERGRAGRGEARRRRRDARGETGGTERPERPEAEHGADFVIADLDSPAAGASAAAGPVSPGTVEAAIEASPALSQALYAIAEDAADEQAADEESGDWAALLRDGEEVARSVSDPDVIARLASRDGEIDPDEWERLRASAGAIVMRDRRGRVSARLFPAPDDLWAEWASVMAAVNPNQPGPGTTRSPESDDNPA